MSISRRQFVGSPIAMAALARRRKPPIVVSTWEFGRKANARAWQVLFPEGSALDAVEQGINDAELDPDNRSVGFGGLPNEEGEVTLDAMIMDGRRHAAGAVGCLKRVKAAVSVARRVLEKTKHTLLVGEDATRFAVKMGFREEELFTEDARRRWREWVQGGRKGDFWSHDTIGMVSVDARGDVAAACSTSGLAFKIAGRVGDSPIPGSGAYCDNAVGGAAATGNGDVMMRFCPAILAVELMRQGRSPAEACRESLARIEAKGYGVTACLLALNVRGEHGAARIGGRPFPYAVRSAETDEVFRV